MCRKEGYIFIEGSMAKESGVNPTFTKGTNNSHVLSPWAFQYQASMMCHVQYLLGPTTEMIIKIIMDNFRPTN